MEPEIVAAFIIAGGTILAAFISARAIIKRSKAKILESVTKPAKIPPKDKRNSVMLVGIGGSGKTTLIKGLLKDPSISPNFRTEDYAIYQRRVSLGQKETDSNCHIFISDYAGQNLGQLIRSFLEQQKLRFSPMKYNYVTSLIVIVDVVAPPTDPKGKIESMDSPDESRIMKHIGQWNESALSAVFGLLTNSLQYVCLFINKMDVITSHDEVSFEKIENDYLPIKNILKKYCHTIDFEVLLGSAKNGMNVQELENRILQHSVSDSE